MKPRSHFSNIELLRLTSLEGPLLDVGAQLSPERNAGQQQSGGAQHDDEFKFGHVISLSDSRGGEAAGAQRGPAAFFPGVDCGIDFDDEREFDFSRVKARPRLRLVISNSSPVKA